MLAMFAMLFVVCAAENACKNPANAIVAENCLEGSPSTEWDVNGAGTDDIVGFTTKMSYDPGDTVDLKIKADEEYDVDIWRLGWYGGNGARRVGKAVLLKHDPQPACSEEDLVVDCGNWKVSARYVLPGNATSGLYFARLTLPTRADRWRADASKVLYDPNHVEVGRDPLLPPDVGPHAYGAAGKGKFRLQNALKRPRASLAFFVVKSRWNHDVVFQTSDTTWHAYNGWGGLTTYGSFEYPLRHAPNRSLIPPEDRTMRAYKRSYNTPLITRDYRAVNAPFGCEYPAIRFLEKLGIDLHYVSGIDLGTGSDALFRSSTYLSVGHDEYWSYAQRKAIVDAQANGTHTFFWSGNEAYWAIRFEKSRFSDDFRTLVCYKETQSKTKLDPRLDTWTGTFRDARKINPIGPMPENAVTGTMFAANAQRNDALAVDPHRFGGHRLWKHTSIRKAHDRGSKTPIVLYPGLLGHEWDEPVDNGVSPAGLQKLSETSIDNVQAIQDYGATFDSGTARHSLVLHRQQSGAYVFGAGTVQWSWGLDDHHDVNDPQRVNKYSIRIAKDQRGPCLDIQQFTVNLFAVVGVPFSLTSFPLLVKPQIDDRDHRAPSASVDDVRTLEIPGGLVVLAVGHARDHRGNVASVEIAWIRGSTPIRWFMTNLDAIAGRSQWSFPWGDEPWHQFHGPAPPPGDVLANISLRVTDDSGNMAEYHGLTVGDDNDFLPGKKKWRRRSQDQEL